MKVLDLLNIVKNEEGYVNGSLEFFSSQSYGVSINGIIYEYLCKTNLGYANKKRIFIELDPTESELDILDKTVLSFVEIY